MGFLTVLKELALILLVFASVNFTLSVILKRNDVADVGWGIGFILVCLYLVLYLPLTPVAWTMYTLVMAWGLRLSVYIGYRNSRKSEDFRYKKWREDWGKSFYLRSFLQVFLLQMIILLLISLPLVITAIHSRSESLGTLQWCGVAFWFLGFSWQAVADYQLSQFKKSKARGILKSGLWKYSRHPNYFGEMVMWWSIFLLAFGATSSFYTFISPLLITYLLVKVSGVPMLEDKYKNNSEYRDYVASTPAIIPFLK